MLDHWIDVHAHFTPPTTPEARHARWEAMRSELFLVPEPHQWSPEATLDYMDRAGIAMQMLSNIPKVLKGPPGFKRLRRFFGIGTPSTIWVARRIADG